MILIIIVINFLSPVYSPLMHVLQHVNISYEMIMVDKVLNEAACLETSERFYGVSVLCALQWLELMEKSHS